MGIAVSGIASGIDSDSIISQLMALENQRIMQIQRRIAIEETRRAAYDDLSGRVEGLRRTATKFSDDNIFGELQASSSDAGVVTAKATDKAKAGTYSLEVLQTAKSHRIAAQGFVDKTATGVAAEEGVFSFTVGNSEAVELEVDSDTSLTGLANKINDSNAGVTATIVNDGTSLNKFRMVLTANATGEDGEISVVDNDTTLDFNNNQIETAVADKDNSEDYGGAVTSGGTYTGSENTSFIVDIITEGAADGTAKYRLSTDGGLTYDDNNGLGFDVTSAGPIALTEGVVMNFEDDGTLRVGDSFTVDVFHPELDASRDAMFKVNGITVKKSSNTVNDVFDGLKFDLHSAEPGKTVNISVSQDAGAVEETLMGFVGAYNGVVGFLNSQFKFDPETSLPPPLAGDSAARQVERDIKRVISMRMPGLDSSTVSSLTELGMTSNEKTGILSFNSTDLSKYLTDDPDAVRRVLTSFGERLSGDFTFVRRNSDSLPGKYDVTVTQARTRAEVSGSEAAEVLANDEELTLQFNRRTQINQQNLETIINLQAGDTPEAQVTRINEAIEGVGYEALAFLDAGGRIGLRATNYGNDYLVGLISDRAAAVGTSQIGNLELLNTGTNLEGRIGSASARILDGNRMKGADGFKGAGVEVEIPDDVEGKLGSVRIVDGLAAVVPKIADALTGSNGAIRSRADGVSVRIASLEDQITKQEKRMAMTEDRLRRQFTRLEVTMGQLNALGDYVSQQMESISAMNNRKK